MLEYKSMLKILAVGLTFGILAACASKKSSDTSASAAPPPPPPPVAAEPLDADRPAPGSQADLVATVGADRVFFAFDSSELRPDARDTLRRQAEWLEANAGVRLTIEGHCDERGTREYNLALGERRANAVRSYLVALGVDSGRLSTISYGKERPAVLGSNEDAWSQNRRAVSVVSGAAGS